MQKINTFVLKIFILMWPIFFVTSAFSLPFQNYFRFINNFGSDFVISLHSNDNAALRENISPFSISAQYPLSTDHQGFHRGFLLVQKKGDDESMCRFNLTYSYYSSLGNYFKENSEVIEAPVCSGSLHPHDFLVVNDTMEAQNRPIAMVFTNAIHVISLADCGAQGGNNCIIASPAGNISYQNQGSTLLEALKVQSQIARFEPLSVGQVLGTHNSVISHVYTQAQDWNVSYIDPNQILSLTAQLNQGIRQLELDIGWFDGKIVICHNHVDPGLSPMLCKEQTSFADNLQEIKAWVMKNRDALLYLYLDVNLSVAGHEKELDIALSRLEPFVYKPFFTPNKTPLALKASLLTPAYLTGQLNKNIIITNDNEPSLNKSTYVYTSIEGSNASPLPEHGADDFIKRHYLTADLSLKYQNMQAFYSDDNLHQNMWRLNEDRSVIGNRNETGDDNGYSGEFFTTQNIKQMLAYPINIFSIDMLGNTCASSSCENHPIDPRLFSFLWSWDLGYPLLSQGAKTAYINLKTGHFRNNQFPLLIPEIEVLCLGAQASPSSLEPLPWFSVSLFSIPYSLLENAAKQACQGENGVFAAPTTAYWLDDVLRMLAKKQHRQEKILINYVFKHKEWIANEGRSLILK